MLLFFSISKYLPIDTALITQGFMACCTIGCLNLIIASTLRAFLPYIFTQDPAVAALATRVLPLIGVTAFLDGINAAAHGILRGIGKQAIGGPVNLVAYYVISLPAALAFAFALGWKLFGLYVGLAIGLFV